MKGISPDNLELFEHEGVVYDQRNGIGAVPDVLNVAYKGFVVLMRPSLFLAVTPRIEDANDHAARHVRAGNTVSMGFLEIDLTEEGDTFSIRSHEGRHRAAALLDHNGDREIPVALLLRHGDRARDVTDEDLVKLASGVRTERTRGEVQRYVEGPLFERVIHLNEEKLVSELTRRPGPGR